MKASAFMLIVSPGGGVLGPPSAPSNLAASNTSDSVIALTWTDNSSDETAFSIERSLTGAGGWSEIATPAANATSANDTGLDPSTTYYYRIRANRSGTYSDYSNTANDTTDAIPAPSGLGVAVVSSSALDLSWTDNSTGEDDFRIERSPNGTDSWVEIATNAANDVTYSDTGLSANTAYYYRVRAKRSTFYSAYSSTANATTSHTLDTYIASLSPVLDYNFRETSGTSVANIGSGTGTGVNTSCTVDQTGQTGAHEAYSFNGTTSLITVTNHSSFASLTTWEWLFLCNPTNAGESNLGYFMFFTAAHRIAFNSVARVLTCVLDGGTDMTATTSTAMAAGTWQLLNVSYDDSGDRVAHIFINAAEASYTTSTAMTGSYVTPSADLIIGNNSAASRTFNGLIDRVCLFPAGLTPTNRSTIKTLAGL